MRRAISARSCMASTRLSVTASLLQVVAREGRCALCAVFSSSSSAISEIKPLSDFTSRRSRILKSLGQQRHFAQGGRFNTFRHVTRVGQRRVVHWIPFLVVFCGRDAESTIRRKSSACIRTAASSRLFLHDRITARRLPLMLYTACTKSRCCCMQESSAAAPPTRHFPVH